MNRIELFKGDCLTIMDELIAKGIVVDAIICDPPYQTTACSWDTLIPFNKHIMVEKGKKLIPMYQDEWILQELKKSNNNIHQCMEEFNELAKEGMWCKLNKLIKPNGAIVLFGSEPFSSALRMSNIKNYKEDVVWLKNKSASGMQAKQKHLKVHENIMVFANETKYIFNPQKWLVQDKEFLTQRKTLKEFECGNTVYASATRVRKKDDGTRNPISIVTCAVPITPAKTKTYANHIDINFHSTQKPIELMEYLIKTYTNENEIILDFTMGSGSTGVASKNLNRGFIGIELNDYFEIAEKRIEEAVLGSSLEVPLEMKVYKLSKYS